MESYLKKFMRELLEHKNSLNEYVDELYADDTREDDLNALFGALKKEGLLSCIYADNRAYEVQLTLKGKNLPASELKLSDKEELLLIISSIDDIEKHFHKNEGKRNLGEWIHDVPEFQDWLQQVTFYLQKIQDKKYSQYILETINEGRNWGGITDRIVFNKFTSRLKSIAKNIDLYYEDEEPIQVKEKNDIMQTYKKTPMIFISHSSKDEPHVELIVKLLKDMGFNHEKVFCSSIPGYGIGLSQDIFDTLLKLFNDHELYVIFVHSPNYYGSAVGLNEMGAAWVLRSNFCSFLLPGFGYSDMKGVVDSNKIAIKIDGDRRTVQNLINELYNDLADFFSTTRDTSIIWESVRDEFIDKMNAIQVVAASKQTSESESIPKETEKTDSGVAMMNTDLSGSHNKSNAIGESSLMLKAYNCGEVKEQAVVARFDMGGYISGEFLRDKVISEINRINKMPMVVSEAVPFGLLMDKKVELDKTTIDIITTVAKELDIILNEDFFDIGELREAPLLSSIPFGGRDLRGSQEEKEKYNAIISLKNDIYSMVGHLQMEQYYDKFFGVELLLSNDGTDYDEDIDIELSIPEEKYVDVSNIPVPTENVDMEDEWCFADVFEIHSTKDFISYKDTCKNRFWGAKPTSVGIFGGRDYEEEYREILNDIFEYDVYEDGSEIILKVHYDYLKQHQTAAFPTWIFFKNINEDFMVKYKITSKKNKEIIEREIQIKAL